MASPPTTPAPAKPFEKLAAAVDVTAKILAIAGIGLYGLGILVTNTFLAKYGIVNFAVLKPQAIFTGIWTIALFAFASLPTFAVVHTLVDPRLSRRARLVQVPVVFFISLWAATFLAWGFYKLVLSDSVARPENFWLLANGIPGWRALLVLFAVFPSLAVVTEYPRSKLSSRTPCEAAITVWTGIALPALLIGAGIVGYETFESVRLESGGGSPPSATFYFSSEGKDLLTELKKRTSPTHDGDPLMTITGDLVYDTGDRYLVRIDSCQPSYDDPKKIELRSDLILLDRRSVEAVIDSSPLSFGRISCTSTQNETKRN